MTNNDNLKNNLRDIIYEDQYKIKLGLFMMFFTKAGFILTALCFLYFGFNVKGLGVATFLMFPVFKYSTYRYFDKNRLPVMNILHKIIKKKR
ncbi:MAG: hypothetical protein M0R46_09865 [Candidatus Muirbacterium halophilum]|nr:hypothetical protein [Candidatus Muirbacterium halophilum]